MPDAYAGAIATTHPSVAAPAATQPGATSSATQSAATTHPTAATQPITRAAPITGPWWETFNDPILNRLVDEARQSNLDLRAATARIRQARAQRGVVGSSLWPDLNSSGSYTHSQGSKNVGAGNSSFGAVPGGRRDLWQAGFDANWEIDVFGGARRDIEASNADIQAALANRDAVMLTLLGDVARNYIELRGFQREVRIAQDNVEAQRGSLNLTQAKFKAGLTSDLDVARAEAQVASTAAAIPSLQTAVQQSIHQLSVLTGRAPEALIDLLETAKPIPVPPPQIPVGLPSELLRRRPDIQQAERSLAAATARIGVATADLFPRFTLTGSLGLQSNKFEHFTDSSSTFWSFGPGFSWPIFNAGRIRSNIDVAKAQTDELLANYQSTVLGSLQEVEDAMVAYRKEYDRREALSQSVDANQRAVLRSQQLYQRGLTTFLDVLDAQRALYTSQDLLVQSDTLVSSDAVALFKALGGGWDVPVPQQQARAR
jgi:NodT family efflux transporter outer membrane factor (OMF) lipoprotein